ncbi:glucose-1-phosphate thymidylyltransferase RfbA [Butyricicoccus sp. Marseille-Q5471]|uniref:glucose-1-phosphate thymidylyltransferase RfbA n=1 Tax=Butyricicoccus sp. Marseille-Q5471 TaxID=3039493 RepID=UPI0024BC1318|nr:glucose-1-phosphate thymidylyltransferase RfbA [Butyricicoccus sp. Marseille-Q5471]
MKGIILAAGKGTRLYPMTKPACKPLLPIYDKPMLYYPLSVLQQADIREVLIIVPPDDKEQFERLLGNGSHLGMKISYKEQFIQRGIADAFIVGEEFIGNDSVCLVLGDNLFYGAGLKDCLEKAQQNKTGATIFGCYVDDPRAFGVVEFDDNGKAISIEEKPVHPKSNYIVPGLYFYDNRVVEIAKQLKPSARGELEITAVNNAYLELDELNVVTLGKEFVWLDAGTEDSLLQAARVIQNLQRTTGNYVACIEEDAYKNGWISDREYQQLGRALEKTRYGK